MATRVKKAEHSTFVVAEPSDVFGFSFQALICHVYLSELKVKKT